MGVWIDRWVGKGRWREERGERREERGERREDIVVGVIVVTSCRDMNCTYVIQEGFVDKSLITITASVYCVYFG